MSIEVLREKFIRGLDVIHFSEMTLLKLLPRMREASRDNDTKTLFADRITETEQQVMRLDRIFTQLGIKPDDAAILGESTFPIVAALAEVDRDLVSLTEPAKHDRTIIASCQAIKQYEIALYRSLAEWSNIMGMSHATDTLEQNLKDELFAQTKLDCAAAYANGDVTKELEEEVAADPSDDEANAANEGMTLAKPSSMIEHIRSV
jgi:ferritin-like metal-binding protein YciE